MRDHVVSPNYIPDDNLLDFSYVPLKENPP